MEMEKKNKKKEERLVLWMVFLPKLKNLGMLESWA